MTTASTAIADETHADCEPTQPWIGYARTDPARAILEPAIAGAGASLEACEGEQWDGQDSVRPDVDGSCTPSVEPVPGRLAATWCAGPDPNAGGSELTSPLRARATSVDAREAYLAADALLLARAALYVGTCGAGESGLEGDASCGGTRELRVGVYARDNTPNNVVTQLSPQCLFSITGCGSTESDCSQETYQRGAYVPPSQCGRDNTALGARLVLP